VRLAVDTPGILSSITDGLSDLFAREGIAVEMVQPQSDGVSFAVPMSPQLPELLRVVDPSVRIEVEEDDAIATLVGEGIASEPAILQRALSAVARKAPVRMLTQGGSARAIRFAVPEAQLGAAVESLHREFFRAADPEIFATTPESAHEQLAARIAAEAAIVPDNNWPLTPIPTAQLG